MPREVDLKNAFMRHGAHERFGVEAVVVGRYIDVVHVEQEPNIRAFGDLGNELPLAQRARAVGEVARGVLERERHLEEILNHARALHRSPHRFRRVRDRQEVVQVRAARARPAKVVADPGCLRAASQ